MTGSPPRSRDRNRNRCQSRLSAGASHSLVAYFHATCGNAGEMGAAHRETASLPDVDAHHRLPVVLADAYQSTSARGALYLQLGRLRVESPAHQDTAERHLAGHTTHTSSGSALERSTWWLSWPKRRWRAWYHDYLARLVTSDRYR